MRKLVIALTATVAMLFAGSLVWKAEATTPVGDPGVAATVKNFSPVIKAACGAPGPHCGPRHHWVCNGHGRCWCAPC